MDKEKPYIPSSEEVKKVEEMATDIEVSKEKIKGERIIVENEDGEEKIFRVIGKGGGFESLERDGEMYILQYPMAGNTAYIENIKTKEREYIKIDKIITEK